MLSDYTAPSIQTVHETLLGYYGAPQIKPQRPPLDELVLTILSQNTADVNTARAYQNLTDTFPTWQKVVEAPTETVAEAIRIGGLANIKAPRIQAILRKVLKDQGELSLNALTKLPPQEIKSYLTSLKGVGPKTAACVMLFSMHVPAMPVDTHVHRVALRLGLVPEKTTAEKTQELLEEATPSELYYPLHLLMIQHGRTLCHARNPECSTCPLQTMCPFHLYLRKTQPSPA